MGAKTDIIIIGGGPAGVSAALTARRRNKSVRVIANPQETTALYKAKSIENYPGLQTSGAEMMRIFREQLEQSGAELIQGRALSVLPIGKSIGVAVGNDYYEASAVILACGAGRKPVCSGEKEFLGRGVSYCATCDGMLYRGKTVAVIGKGAEVERDSAFLKSLGCTVHEFTGREKLEIHGAQRADKLMADGVSYDIDCVFILADTVMPGSLVPGLELQNGAVKTGKAMETSVRGIFAAGDLTGLPHQLGKAVGEGNVAGLSAVKYVDDLNKGE